MELVPLPFTSLNGTVTFHFIDLGILGGFFFELASIFLLAIMSELDKKNSELRGREIKYQRNVCISDLEVLKYL